MELEDLPVPDEIETAYRIAHNTVYEKEDKLYLTHIPRGYEKYININGRRIFRSKETGRFVSKEEIHDTIINELLN